MTMKLLITGATGYIGQRLSVLAAASGHEVVCATRQPCPATYTWLPYDLRGPAPEFPAGTQVLIHLAADTSTSADADADDEIKAAHALIRCAQQGSARFIFISSQTAEATAPGVYGRTKWRIEQHVLAAGGSVIRPGQVYGGPERGLFGLLSGLVRRSPFIPILMPAPGVQPIHVDDLAASILAVVERDDLHAEILNLGAVQPIAFGRFLMSIAAHRVRAARLPVPLPVALLRLLRLSLGQSLSAKLGLERIFPSSTCRPWTANVPCRNSASGCAPCPRHASLRPWATSWASARSHGALALPAQTPAAKKPGQSLRQGVGTCGQNPIHHSFTLADALADIPGAPGQSRCPAQARRPGTGLAPADCTRYCRSQPSGGAGVSRHPTAAQPDRHAGCAGTHLGQSAGVEDSGAVGPPLCPPVVAWK